MDTSFTPINYDCKEIIQDAISTGQSGKIFYFNDAQQLDCVEAKIERLIENKEGIFALLTSPATIRVDRIITLFGKPFAAYEEYDAYANACLDCKGGYEVE